MKKKRRLALGVMLAFGMVVAWQGLHARISPSRVRTFSVGGVARGQAVDSTARRVYLAISVGNDQSGQLLLLDATTGARVRTLRLPGYPTALLPDPARSHLVLGQSGGPDGRLLLLDARTGKIWRTIARGFDVSAVAIDHNLLAASGYPTVIPCTFGSVCPNPVPAVRIYDLRNGALLRSFPLREEAALLAVDVRISRLVLLGASSGGSTACTVMDLRTGRVLRRLTLGPWSALLLEPATAHAFVAAASAPLANAGSITMLDAVRGTTLRTIRTAGAPGSMALDTRHGRLFALALGPARKVVTAIGGEALVPTGGGRLYTIDAHRGSVLHVTTIGRNPTGLAVDDRSGHVFVATTGPLGLTTVRSSASASSDAWVADGGGTLTEVDGASGAIVDTMGVGGLPRLVAVDEATGRVFVASDGGLVRASDPWRWLPGWLRRYTPFVPPPPARRSEPPSLSTLAGSPS